MKQWALGLMSNDEKRSILDQHKTLYNGYKTMQPKVSNTQPLYMQDFANDKNGITVNNKGNVKTYMNVGINEQVENEMCSECGGMMQEGECMECGYNGGEMGEEMQQVKDLENVEDLNLSDRFDYTEEEMYEDDALDADALQNVTGQDIPHDADDMAPDGMDDDSDYDRGMMSDSEVEEQVGGGSAPYTNYSSIKEPYTFISGGPLKEDGEEIDEGGAYVIDFDGKPRDKKPGEKISAFSLKDFEDDSWEEIHPEDDSLDIDDDIKESVLKQKNRIVEMMNRMKGFN